MIILSVRSVHDRTVHTFCTDKQVQHYTTTSAKAISFKPETDTGDDQRLERRLFYNVEGAPDGPVLLTASSSVNRENALVGYVKH